MLPRMVLWDGLVTALTQPTMQARKTLLSKVPLANVKQQWMALRQIDHAIAVWSNLNLFVNKMLFKRNVLVSMSQTMLLKLHPWAAHADTPLLMSPYLAYLSILNNANVIRPLSQQTAHATVVLQEIWKRPNFYQYVVTPQLDRTASAWMLPMVPPHPGNAIALLPIVLMFKL